MMRRPRCCVGWLAAAMLAAAGCGSSSSGSRPATGTAADSGEAGDATSEGHGGADASPPEGGAGWDGGEADVVEASDDAAEAESDAEAPETGGDAGTGDWKTSLSECWTEPGCHRALVIAHGGQWDATNVPFLSFKAFEQAWQTGADGIEADILVSKDGVPIVAHSSPIEYYESLDCGGKKIEEMLASEVTQCHLGANFGQKFQRMDDVLDWAAGKLIMEWDVKQPADLAATIALILQKNAQDRSTILVDIGELQTVLPTISGWDELHYIGDCGSTGDVATGVTMKSTHNIFLFEMDRTYGDATEAQVTDLIKNVANPSGIHVFGASDQYTATVQNHVDVYHQGFDVVLSYNVPNGVQARAQVNVERGYGP